MVEEYGDDIRIEDGVIELWWKARSRQVEVSVKKWGDGFILSLPDGGKIDDLWYGGGRHLIISTDAYKVFEARVVCAPSMPSIVLLRIIPRTEVPDEKLPKRR